MKLGIMAYATKTGLGYQTKALYKYLKPDKVMLCDISQYNGLKVNEDWYNFDIRTNGFPTNDEIDSFLNGLDIVFVCETPLNYHLFSEARSRGIKTILQVNPEFCDYFQRDLPQPTVFALPSLWMIDKFIPQKFKNVIHLPVPIDTQELPKRVITEANTFFHIAGRPAIHDRNGTLDFIEAVRAIQNQIDAKFLLYIQQMTPEIKKALDGTKIVVRQAEEPADLYKEGDVLIMPRKYGGNCLPIQDAIGSGIPVITTDISPNNNWLPKDWLVKVSGKFTFNTRLPIDAYTVDRQQLSALMILLNQHPANIAVKAKQARDIAESMGWDKMAVRYETLINRLCMSPSSV